MKEINVCITLFPSQDKAAQSTQTDFAALFLPLAKKIFVIGDVLPGLSSGKIHAIRLHEWASGKPQLYKVAMLLLSQLDTCFNLIKLVRKCDIVILASLGELEVMPLLMAKLFRKKVVIIQGGSYFKTFELIYGRKRFGLGRIILYIAGLLARVNRALADGIAVDTENAVESLGLNRYRGKIYVCGISFINADVFKIKTDLKDRRNVVGYIGRFSQEKGVMNFARAIPLILARRPDIEFLMYGDGPLLNEIEEELRMSGSYSEVTLTGRVPRERIPNYLNEMMLLVMPSYLEGLPKVLLEAVVCGTPVLAMPVGGIPDLIEDEKTGFILEDNSPECIAQGVIRALAHPKLHEIAEMAHRLIENRYTYELAVEGWRNALQELIKGKTEPEGALR